MEEDPLEELYTSEDEFDREALAEALNGVIKIDEDDGSPIRREAFHDLDGKQRFAAYLLYRRATAALGEISDDEIGISSSNAAQEIDVNNSTLRNYTDESWVKNDESRGGYFISGYDVRAAVDCIEDSEE